MIMEKLQPRDLLAIEQVNQGCRDVGLDECYQPHRNNLQTFYSMPHGSRQSDGEEVV